MTDTANKSPKTPADGQDTGSDGQDTGSDGQSGADTATDWLAEGRRLQAYSAEPLELARWLHENAERLLAGCERAERYRTTRETAAERIWCVYVPGPGETVSLHRTKDGAERACAARIEEFKKILTELEDWEMLEDLKADPHRVGGYAVGEEVLHD